MSISDMIVVMKDGLVHQIGKPQEVYDNPVNLFVAKFLGTPPINVFRGKIAGGALYVGEDRLFDVSTDAKQGDVYVGIRPEGFVLDNNGPLHCALSRVEVMGRDMSVVAAHPAFADTAIRAIIDSENISRIAGDTVAFDVKPGKVLVFDQETEERIYI